MRLTGFIPGRGGSWELLVENGIISDIRVQSASSLSPTYTTTPVEVPAGGSGPAAGETPLWLSAGFFDIQVNGYAGVSFNEDVLTVEGVEKAVRALWLTGTALVFPTVTTGSPERLLYTFRTLERACAEAAPEVRHSIAGYHLEGPYISPEDGPRGAHPREFVRPPSWDEFQRLQEAAGGRIRLITLAPEVPGAIEFIEKAAKSGVVVALGHTGAQPEDIAKAVAAGALLSTHLGNGSHALIRRHPNYIWEQMANDALYASLVPDGFHLPPPVLKCMIRAKGVEHTILTTDAAGVAGLPPGIYSAQGRDLELVAGGPVKLRGTPFLAGSALRLNDGLTNAMNYAGVNLAEAVRMVTVNPARLMNLETKTGSLQRGMEANLTLFRLDGAGRVIIEKTIVKGQVVYQAK
ncbi:MAG TPA: amidohydrolase family protein [Firmicutes bacterium]|nr:amidohydrolase family protein [Bacillota bacterium]